MTKTYFLGVRLKRLLVPTNIETISAVTTSLHRNQSEIKSARYTGATSELRKRGRLVLGLLGHLEPGDVERRNGREPGRAFNEIGLEHQDVLGFGFDSRQFRSVRQIVLEKRVTKRLAYGVRVYCSEVAYSRLTQQPRV